MSTDQTVGHGAHDVTRMTAPPGLRIIMPDEAPAEARRRAG